MKAEDIIEQIRQGRKEAAAQGLMVAFKRPMTRFFLGQGVSAEDAEEVFVDTAVTIILKVEQYRDEGKAEAWFWQIARNKLIDYYRKNRRHELGRVRPSNTESDSGDEWELIEEPDSAPEQLMLKKQLDDCVEKGVARLKELDPERAEAMNLQLKDFSIEEIAAQIGRTKGATKEYLSQCRKKLAPYVEHCTELLSG
jgi:RNA polymerase sigma factor (sigma-70 family)